MEKEIIHLGVANTYGEIELFRKGEKYYLTLENYEGIEALEIRKNTYEDLKTYKGKETIEAPWLDKLP